MIVAKFGGTSVRDGLWIDRCLSIVESQIDRSPVLVSSAMGDSTDILEDIIVEASSGKVRKSEKLLETLSHRHLETAKALLEGKLLKKCIGSINSLFNELRSLVTGMTLIKECSPRLRDTVLSFGERLATEIIASRAEQRGIDTRLLDSRKFIRTDESFGRANVDLGQSEKLIKKHIAAQSGTLYVCQGFIGSGPGGVTTTIGRGGSDHTATIIGTALSAEEVQIWTDVDGIMSSDPRIIPEAHTIPEISYAEAAELAYFGAKVVHPSSIQGAVYRGIPVFVKNTGKPDFRGTAILAEVKNTGVCAIAGKKGIRLITINSSRMLNAFGFLAGIFNLFEKYKISVDLVATSEVSVSMTVDSQDDLAPLLKEMERLGKVSTETNKCIISLVGKNLWKEPSFFQQVFAALEAIPVELISLGSSDINLSMVVPEDRGSEAIERLHRKFFPKKA